MSHYGLCGTPTFAAAGRALQTCSNRKVAFVSLRASAERRKWPVRWPREVFAEDRDIEDSANYTEAEVQSQRVTGGAQFAVSQ